MVGRKLLSSLMTVDHENDSRDELLSKTGNWHGCRRMYCDICLRDSLATTALKASLAAFPQANSCLKARAYFAWRMADDMHSGSDVFLRLSSATSTWWSLWQWFSALCRRWFGHRRCRHSTPSGRNVGETLKAYIAVFWPLHMYKISFHWHPRQSDSVTLQFWVGIANPQFWGSGGRRGPGMVPFERALVSFYRPSIVTFPLSLRVSHILPLASLCDHKSAALYRRTKGRTDRRTTCDPETAHLH